MSGSLDKTNSEVQLTEKEELLLCKLFDDECSSVERAQAQSLPKNNPLANLFMDTMRSVQGDLVSKSANQTFNKTPEAFWNGVEMRIEQERRAEVLLGRRVSEEENEEVKTGFSLFDWFKGNFVFGGLSGAVATAALLVMVIPSISNSNKGIIQPQNGAIASQSVDGALSPVSLNNQQTTTRRRPVILNDRTNQAIEVDWMRGNGPLKIIPDASNQRSQIIWVKRRNAPQARRQIVAGQGLPLAAVTP